MQKCYEDFKSPEMSTNTCQCGKVIETNLVQRNSENHGEKMNTCKRK